MSKFNVVRRCYACGAILQGEDKNKEGYVEQRLLDETPLSHVLFCEKCWTEQRYNIAPRHPNVDPDFLSMLYDAQASDALIVYVVDLFSFESSFIPEVTEAIEGLRILVIANKRDLLPASLDDDALREYVAHRFRRAKLHVTRDDVVLASLTYLSGAEGLANHIQELRRGHDVYIIGAVGAGKTLFVSNFLRGYDNRSGMSITTANYPGTNLRVMQIPLDGSSCLYDTPGTSIENSVLGIVEPSVSSEILPKRAVKARHMVLAPGEAIFIGGLARFELLASGEEKQNVACYFSEEVDLIKSKTKAHEAAFFKHIERGSAHPSSKNLTSSIGFDAFEITVDEVGQRDIGIEGLGWISFTGNKQIWRVYLPKGVSVFTTRAKIGG